LRIAYLCGDLFDVRNEKNTKKNVLRKKEYFRDGLDHKVYSENIVDSSNISEAISLLTDGCAGIVRCDRGKHDKESAIIHGLISEVFPLMIDKTGRFADMFVESISGNVLFGFYRQRLDFVFFRKGTVLITYVQITIELTVNG